MPLPNFPKVVDYTCRHLTLTAIDRLLISPGQHFRTPKGILRAEETRQLPNLLAPVA